VNEHDRVTLGLPGAPAWFWGLWAVSAALSVLETQHLR